MPITFHQQLGAANGIDAMFRKLLDLPKDVRRTSPRVGASPGGGAHLDPS
jgi:hypothetical protein